MMIHPLKYTINASCGRCDAIIPFLQMRFKWRHLYCSRVLQRTRFNYYPSLHIVHNIMFLFLPHYSPPLKVFCKRLAVMNGDKNIGDGENGGEIISKYNGTFPFPPTKNIIIYFLCHMFCTKYHNKNHVNFPQIDDDDMLLSLLAMCVYISCAPPQQHSSSLREQNTLHAISVYTYIYIHHGGAAPPGGLHRASWVIILCVHHVRTFLSWEELQLFPLLFLKVRLMPFHNNITSDTIYIYIFTIITRSSSEEADLKMIKIHTVLATPTN